MYAKSEMKNDDPILLFDELPLNNFVSSRQNPSEIDQKTKHAMQSALTSRPVEYMIQENDHPTQSGETSPTHRNVEIKFKDIDMNAVLQTACLLALTDEWRGSYDSCTMWQKDTYFQTTESGVRKKVREFPLTDSAKDTAQRRPEVITYSRPDAFIRTSTYNREEIAEGDIRYIERLTQKHGDPIAVVEKKRVLVMLGRTRVHIDTVIGLPGYYAELEVVLRPDEPEENGNAEAERIACQLGLAKAERYKGSYLDMMMTSAKEEQSDETQKNHAHPPEKFQRHPPWLVDLSSDYSDPYDCEDRILECIQCGEEFDSWDPQLYAKDMCYDCELDETEQYLEDCGE